jgi:hypothetical protein
MLKAHIAYRSDDGSVYCHAVSRDYGVNLTVITFDLVDGRNRVLCCVMPLPAAYDPAEAGLRPFGVILDGTFWPRKTPTPEPALASANS